MKHVTAIATLCLLLAAARPAAAQDTHVALIVGLGGEPEHAETFRRWAGTLYDHVTGPLGIPKDRVVYLLEDPQQDEKRATGKSTKAEVEQGLAAMAASS